MGYQNVSTPRFYVSILQWLKATGNLTDGTESPQYLSTSPLDLVDINPSSQSIFYVSSGDGGWWNMKFVSEIGTYTELMPPDNNFEMWLGHNFGTTANKRMDFLSIEGDADGTWLNGNRIVNMTCCSAGGQPYCDLDGFSVAIGDDAHDVTTNVLETSFRYYTVGFDFKLGSYLYGTYYDMPHSPELSLTM